MPRSRNIKPSLFKNEILGEADPLLTILFQGLWCLADREGRLENRPKRIKAEIFPYRDIPDINGYLTELERLGFIHRYTRENHAIIQVLNFSKHQSPHKTERASELPEYLGKSDSCAVTEDAPLNNESVHVKESLIPDSGFLIPDSCNNPPNPPKGGKRFTKPTIDELVEKFTGKVPNPQYEAEAFFDFYESKGWFVGKNKMKSWESAVGNWIRRRNENGTHKQTLTRSQKLEESKQRFLRSQGVNTDGPIDILGERVDQTE